ncbi:MAG: thermonuclease family protein [Thermoanaerobaculia bacterium]|nr:thermonuclease family protein [Thermoanaerobaculia bacterium]
MKNLFILLPLLCLAVLLNAQQLQPATVKAVHDGDSFKISIADAQKPDSAVWVRLYGVDAPEVRFPGVIPFDQPYGRAAADSVRKLIKGQTVLVKYRYSDVYKRSVCEIFFTVKNPEQATDTLDLAQHIVSKGWAWYRTEQKNTKANNLMKKIQAYAKNQKIGLWGEKGRTVRPETFRRKFRM